MALRSKTQRTLLLGFIFSIVGCGLVGIYCLSVGTIGFLEARILATTGAVGAASILAMASAVPWERRRWHPIGPLGILAVSVSFVLSQVLTWYAKALDSEALVKAFFISIVVAVALPHIGLLAMAQLKRQWTMVQIATVAVIGILAAQIILSVALEVSDGTWYRFLGIFSIIVACGTVSIPILHRMSAMHVREGVRTTALMLSIVCPRCATKQELGVGHSKCVKCALRFRIEIEEEQCRKCGYPLYQLESANCPECGTAISQMPAVTGA
jgi:FtsH-binding integral membrane protein